MRQKKTVSSSEPRANKASRVLQKKKNLGKGYFEKKSVKRICNEAGVTGSGLNNYMTNHGLRSSMTILLKGAGNSDSSIILRTGHSNVTTLARYHNLRGTEGYR